MEATVIDADTRQPLSGVNVVAHWVLHFGLEGGGRTDLELMETTTDEQGRFSFPAWGPKPIPAGLPSETRMKNQAPELVFFKSGYKFGAMSNEIRGPQLDAGPSARTSDWNGKTIELKKFEGSMRNYASLISGTLTGVSWGRCEWKKIPKMMLTLIREGEWLSGQRISHSLPTMRDIEDTSEGRNCGSVREFLKSQGQ